MSIVPVRTWAVSSCVLLTLFSCTGRATSLASIEPPEGARDMVESESSDYPIKVLSFSVATERDSYSIVHEMESRLRALKYDRCDKSPGQWERVKRHKANGVVAETRILRFYTTGKPGQLAAIVAYQQCDDKGEQCTQNFTVRQQIAPASLPNRDDYMQQVCQ